VSMELLGLDELGFVILSGYRDGRLVLDPEVVANRLTKQVMVLYHTAGHWQLACYKTPLGYQATFRPQSLPSELAQQLKRDAGICMATFASWEPSVSLEGVE